MSKSNDTVKYSDAELAEFKALVEKKLAKSQEQLDTLQAQILENTENSGDEHGVDWSDDSTFNNQMEMLNNMAIRQRKYIQDLKNALIRIENKTYGVCMITGMLIDKKRLMAVPTTTKSLEAKQGMQGGNPGKSKTSRSTPGAKATKKVVTKKSASSQATKRTSINLEMEDEDLLDDQEFDLEEEAISRAKIDFEDLNPDEENS